MVVWGNVLVTRVVSSWNWGRENGRSFFGGIQISAGQDDELNALTTLFF